jgi:hypothetical protein
MSNFRAHAAMRVAFWHLLLSAFVLGMAAALVFWIWYPSPYDKIIYGRELFIIVLLVDMVCGPLLTLILFDPAKSRAKWLTDVALIACIQLGAMAYGVGQVASARPVWLAFEGDRFRIVQANDVDRTKLGEAAPRFQSLGWRGPEVIGVALMTSGGNEYLKSIQDALHGNHPAFRPSRWVAYEEQRSQVLAVAKNISALTVGDRAKKKWVDDYLAKNQLDASAIGAIPLLAGRINDWAVLVDLKTAMPVGYLKMDAW